MENSDREQKVKEKKKWTPISKKKMFGIKKGVKGQKKKNGRKEILSKKTQIKTNTYSDQITDRTERNEKKTKPKKKTKKETQTFKGA